MIEIIEKTHAKLSPSASKRWMTCPASVALENSLSVERKSSIHAATGTVAHEIHEKALVANKHAASWLGEVVECDGFSIKVDQNMVNAVQESVDFILNRIAEYEFDGYDVTLHTEIRSSLEHLKIKGLDGGTCDVVIEAIHPVYGLIVDIIDYKHGQGVAVEVENNTQLLSYALGVVDQRQTEPAKINLIISQPRAFHPAGSIREWSIGPMSLIVWCDNKLIPAAKATQDPNPEFNPDEEACRWCAAAGQCPALAKMSQEIALVDFAEVETIDLPVPTTLTLEQKRKIAVNAPLIREFLNAVEAVVHDEILNGSDDYQDTFKIVEKITRRKFNSDAFDPIASPLLDYLAEDALYTRKEKTITEIEKDLKAELKAQGIKTFVKMASEIMEQVTEKPQGDLTVAPLSDKRKPAQISAVSDFKNLSN